MIHWLSNPTPRYPGINFGRFGSTNEPDPSTSKRDSRCRSRSKSLLAHRFGATVPERTGMCQTYVPVNRRLTIRVRRESNVRVGGKRTTYDVFERIFFVLIATVFRIGSINMIGQ